MKKLAVISDTHLTYIDKLPEKLKEALQGVDFICHAGDIISEEILNQFSMIAPVKAVKGNMDNDKIRMLLKDSLTFTVENRKIILFHGFGAPDGLGMRVYTQFANENPDVIIFGHSHIPTIYWHKGVLLLNPGSISRPRSGLPTISFLTIDGCEITPEIHILKDI